jgi:peptide/nickel transport system permease protein
MLLYVLRRILATIPVMGVVALFVFLLLHLSPGDPAAVIAGDYATPADIARIRAQLGLDRPLYIQFFSWLGRVLTGDLGTSIFSDLPVSYLIGQRLEPTIALSVLTMLITVVVAVPLGVVAAWKAGTWLDRSIMILAVCGFSIPVFVLAYGMVFVFSMELQWLPVQGYKPIGEGLVPFLRSLTLPSIALSAFLIALVTRITRASLLEILDEDYIRTARAKGITERKVLMLHALRNAAVPIVTILGIGVAFLLGGWWSPRACSTFPGWDGWWWMPS